MLRLTIASIGDLAHALQLELAHAGYDVIVGLVLQRG